VHALLGLFISRHQKGQWNSESEQKVDGL